MFSGYVWLGTWRWGYLLSYFVKLYQGGNQATKTEDHGPQMISTYFMVTCLHYHSTSHPIHLHRSLGLVLVSLLPPRIQAIRKSL